MDCVEFDTDFVGNDVPTDFKNDLKDCWDSCSWTAQGDCDNFCGTDGKCCRQGVTYGSAGCDGIFGGDGYHACIPKNTFVSWRQCGENNNKLYSFMKMVHT